MLCTIYGERMSDNDSSQNPVKFRGKIPFNFTIKLFQVCKTNHQISMASIDNCGDGGVIKEILREGKGAVIPARSKAKGT
jgi:hypothetical protein